MLARPGGRCLLVERSQTHLSAARCVQVAHDTHDDQLLHVASLATDLQQKGLDRDKRSHWEVPSPLPALDSCRASSSVPAAAVVL